MYFPQHWSSIKDFIMEIVIEKNIELKRIKEQHLTKIFHAFNVLTRILLFKLLNIQRTKISWISLKYYL